MVQINSSAGQHTVVVIPTLFLAIIMFAAVTAWLIINVSVVGADHAAVSVFQHCLVPLL